VTLEATPLAGLPVEDTNHGEDNHPCRETRGARREERANQLHRYRTTSHRDVVGAAGVGSAEEGAVGAAGVATCRVGVGAAGVGAVGAGAEGSEEACARAAPPW